MRSPHIFGLLFTLVSLALLLILQSRHLLSKLALPDESGAAHSSRMSTGSSCRLAGR